MKYICARRIALSLRKYFYTVSVHAPASLRLVLDNDCKCANLDEWGLQPLDLFLSRLFVYNIVCNCILLFVTRCTLIKYKLLF